ncbi:hypothetical protein FB45DRAFT_1060821 [Roridomyces roridus]|uniref:Uncharacterized protein n=1 Tax=Roridomyces roridus TaxID=1738132 RepID=A0AAD7FHL3_9AGAR|nr:hypothetical protein FB45DRAFT_1060821 [Roridomyces roridus]
MSTQTGAFNVGSSVLYRYVLEGLLGAVGLIGIIIFLRSRFARPTPRTPIRVGLRDIEPKEKPRLYDIFLDLPGRELEAGKEQSPSQEWPDILPLSVWGIDPEPGHPPLAPELCASNTVSTIIAMPSITTLPGDTEDPLPYLEIGVTEVEVRYWPDESSAASDVLTK